jgi:hypothetical protein
MFCAMELTNLNYLKRRVVASNSSAQGFDHLPQFGRPSEAALGGFKGEPGLEGFVILAADRAGQTEELSQRKFDTVLRRSDIAAFALPRRVVMYGRHVRMPRTCRTDIGRAPARA